jgi:DNA replicative helicase MCM subunit Mcm2 (Cdc46/Mcm family)
LIKIGDIVDIVGIIRKSDNVKRMKIEILKKIEHPNYIKLRKFEILKEMKDRKLTTLEDISD